MRTNTQEAVLSAYIASIGKRAPCEAAQDGGWQALNPLNREGVLPEFFVGGFFGRRFASWLVFETGEGVFEHFGDAAVAGFGSAARPERRRVFGTAEAVPS
jgi:hypothetical protein